MVPSGERINQHCVFADTFFSTITGTGKRAAVAHVHNDGFRPQRDRLFGSTSNASADQSSQSQRLA